jgi:hypothetical protein
MKRLLTWSVFCDSQKSVWRYGEYLDSLEKLVKGSASSIGAMQPDQTILCSHGANEANETRTNR